MRAQAPPWESTASSWCCTNNWGGAPCLHRKCVKTSTCAILHAVSTSASLWLQCTSIVSDKRAQVGEGSPEHSPLMFKFKATLSLLVTYACLPTYSRIIVIHLAQKLEIRCIYCACRLLISVPPWGYMMYAWQKRLVLSVLMWHSCHTLVINIYMALFWFWT